MLYDTSNQIQAERAKKRFQSLLDGKKVIELKVKDYRSLSQNNYLHLLFGYVSIETGLDIEYIKQVYYKVHVNSDIYVYEQTNKLTGETVSLIKSSSDISTQDMTLSIERFRNFASVEMELYLPAPNEDEFLKHIAVEVERHKEYHRG